MNKQLPIFEYPGGTPVTFLPPNTEFKWIEPLGGGTLNGPATWGTVRPDGRPAHGLLRLPCDHRRSRGLASHRHRCGIDRRNGGNTQHGGQQDV